jgi:hypothetical protein
MSLSMSWRQPCAVSGRTSRQGRAPPLSDVSVPSGCGGIMTFPLLGGCLCGAIRYRIIRPSYHIWVASRIAWFDIADDLPRHSENARS